jgi:phosphoserine phosphatase RsbU/P
MSVTAISVLRGRLEDRREKLRSLAPRQPQNESLVRLLAEVDAALERMDTGSFGICESCNETIEADRLLADPLITYCLDHLTEPQKRDLERDLELAARIQQSLLPPVSFQLSGWRLRRHFEPLGPVSGDYCDVIAPSPESADFLFVLGDVSGKGVAASMYMAQLHATFRTLASLGLPLSGMMSLANRVFCEGALAGQYATLVCGSASRDGSVELASAGHHPVFWMSSGRVVPLDSTALPLGMFGEGEFQTRTARLAPGDSLFLFTDGLPESFGPSGAEFGLDRLVDCLSPLAGRPPADLISSVLAQVHKFRGGSPRYDDLSILALQRNP